MKDHKKMYENTVPLLDLAPRLKRPLLLWNPLDYVRLLYWAFFFPQAIRWYVDEFGKPGYRGIKENNQIKEVLRNDPVQRRLIFQAFITLIVTVPFAAWGLSMMGISISWFSVVLGVVLGVAFGVLYSVVGGVAVGVAFGVAFGVVGSVAAGVVGIGGDLSTLVLPMALLLALLVAIHVAESVAGGVKVDTEGVLIVLTMLTAMLGVIGGVIVGVTEGVNIRVAGGTTGSLALTMAVCVAGGVAYSIVIIVTSFRLFDYILFLLTRILFQISGKREFPRQPSRMVFKTLPGLRWQLQTWLKQDWQAGLHNANELLAYTLQFIPVVKTINTALTDSPLELLLERTAALTDRPYDWKLIRYGSASLDDKLRQAAIIGLLLLSGRWRRRWESRFPSAPRLDTPSHAACAGFWYWHEQESHSAAEAFAVVKDLPHGPELYGIAQSIVQGENATDLETIADWEQGSRWLDELPSTALRPGTVEALRILRSVAGEARVVLHSEAPLNRSTAIGRANAALTLLIDKDETSCQQPEWPLIKKIAEEWRDILSKAGGVIGEDVLRQPVLNPYEGYSGLPVIGSTFVGRADIMRQIENHWATSGQPASIILYGHRRMGKTSILRNLANRTDANMLFVYLNIQDAGWVDHTGQLLLDFAEAVHRAAVKAGLQAGPLPDEANYTDLGTGRRAFNALLDRLNPQMSDSKRLVLAIDEFELIETGIREKRIDGGLLPYLRSIIQEYHWLGLIFAGLHTLDEMGRDYQSAFFGQAEYIRVGFLTYEDALRLITQPHPDFALEYTPELRDELFRLTYGQPYLLQRLCWEMVTRWNERFLKQGETTPRTLTPDDLAMALTPDLYLSAGYYFDGVWTNVSENERTLMNILAERERLTWSAAELVEAVQSLPSFKESKALEETLQLLLRHDVILEEKGGQRIASELTRRWISLQRNDKK